MNCLLIEQIYLYLEKELSSPEKKKIEYHLTRCLKCRKALEERKILLQAAESLPSIEAPSDFTQRIMNRIFPAKVSIREWLLAFSLGFTIFLATSFIYLLASGQSLSSLFISLFHSRWNQGINISLIFAKLIKLISISLSTIRQILEALLHALSMLTTIISPEIKIIIITITLILTTFLIYGLRKKLAIGEKQ